ncbi:MAG: response regulator [Granulosicoccaceae bacterium]
MPSILIVDDQPHIVRIMKSGLGRHGFDIRTAANGQQALESVREQRPDFILSDIEMPLMNGVTLCENLLAELGQDLPQILIISGHYDQSMNEWLEQFDGKVHFYEKPVSMSRIVEILNELQVE